MPLNINESGERGFTLVETVIYTALIGMILTGFIIMTLTLAGVTSRNYIMEEVHANAVIALGVVADKIRQAESVNFPVSGGSSGSLMLDISGQTAIIDVSDGVMTLTQDGGNQDITSDKISVSNLEFNNLGPAGRDNIRLNFTVTSRNGNSREFTYSRGYHTAISIRR